MSEWTAPFLGRKKHDHLFRCSEPTAPSQELMDGLKGLQKEDAPAKFVLLAPATPSNQVIGPQHDRWQSAEAVAQKAKERLEEEQLIVLEAKSGDGLPFRAIADEIESRRHVYKGVVVSTLSPQVSNWFGQDLPGRIKRRWGLPVHHIIATTSSEFC